MIRAIIAALRAAGLLAATFAAPALGQPLPIYTSPIEITGGTVAFKAFAPDRDTGAMNELPLPPGLLGPQMAALTGTPINLLFDAQWNGTPEQQAAGTSPRQLACEGPQGVRVQVMQQAANSGEAAYNISCNFATTGSVYVVNLDGALYLSYQLFNNTIGFRSTSGGTCHPDHGTFLCPNDPSFTVRFALEMLTLIWTPSICALHAEPATVYFHGVQFESENAAAGIGMFFAAGRFLAGELAMQAREVRSPMSIDPALAELRTSCTTGDPALQAVIRSFTGLETDVGLPGGITFRAIHPAIAAPAFQNVSLPFGDATCQQGFVWREAFAGDVACVTPETRTAAAADNAQAEARRDPNGGPWGPATCLPGYVWREARADDLVCVTPEVRALTAADNAAAPARRVLQPPEYPSFTRPSISAPPIVAAGADFEVTGQFFPYAIDPTKIQLSIERTMTSACNGGFTELESGIVGAPPQRMPLPVTPGTWSSCAYRYDMGGLQPSTQYSFRVRDCDPVTCSPWSAPFATMTVAANSGPAPVSLALDSGVALGSVAADMTGAFRTIVRMPADAVAGTHSLTGSSGAASDTVSLQVTGGSAPSTLMVTGSFFGDQGCPMRPTYNKIAAAREFTLFGSGFGPNLVSIYLDSAAGPSLGVANPALDGTFCAYFTGPDYAYVGNHSLAAVQAGTVRATLPVEVIIVNDPH